MRYRIYLLALTVLLPGCGWINSYLVGSDNSPSPAELQSIEQPIAVRPLWQTDTSSGDGDLFVSLRPAADKSRVFVAGHKGDVTALDVNSGAVLWRIDTDLSLSAGIGLSQELVLVGSIDGDVVGLAQTDGSEVWRAAVTSEVLTPPIGANGIVVVRTVDGTFSGLSELDGNSLWTYQYTVPALTLRGASRPLIAGGAMIAGLDNGKILLLDLQSGAPIGERRIAPPRGRTEIDRLVDIDAEPRLIGNELYVVAYQGNITSFDMGAGNILWSRDFSSHSGLAADALQIYICDSEDTVWALDRRSGSALWKQTELANRRLSAPANSGNYLIVGDFEGYLHWLDKDSGRIVGRLRTDDSGISSAPLIVDETVYVLSNSGRLSVFSATPSG